jgi:MATE family multidrug resistance protein
MVVAVVLNALNIILDIAFVFGLQMDVAGVAYGTLIARYVGLLLAAGLLWYKYSEWLRAYAQKKLLELEPIKEFFAVNRDIFLRTLCLIFTFSFFTAKSATFGDTILAANTILLQLWMIVSYGIDGFAYAAESLIGRYTGSKQPQKVNRAVKYCFIWGIGIGLMASGLYWIFDESILYLFTDQQPVIQAAMLVFGWTIAGPAVSSFCYIWEVFSSAPPPRLPCVIPCL